jgi:diguanylate cyclase (GGDEF)-like protein/PAS domain S-box-containing protein
VAIAEVFLAVGWRPLSPLGGPGLFLVLAAAFWGASGAVGGAAVMFAYLVVSLFAPYRYPQFFSQPGMVVLWLFGIGVVSAAAVLLRRRLLRAHAAALGAARDHRELEALIAYRQWLNSILDNAPALIGYIDAEQRFQFNNLTYEHWLSRPKSEITGRTVREVFGEPEYVKIKPHLERALRGSHVTFHHEHWLRGAVRHAQTSYVPDFDRQGRVRGCFVVAKDIDSVIEEQQELRASQQRYELALGGSAVALWDVDLQTGKVHLGDSFTTLQALTELVHPEDREAVRRSLRDALKGTAAAYVAEHRMRGADGEWKWILSRGRVTQRDPASGRALRMIGTNVDIHERKLAEREIEGRDAEGAGVATQSLLFERLRRALARSQRIGSPLALMHLEVDRYKAIVEALGAPGAEALLAEVGARLRRCVRVTDTVARVGGEQFVVLLEVLKERSDAFRVAEKMLQALREPIAAAGRETAVTASIGVAFPDSGATTPEELIRRAGSSLAAVQGTGRR